MRQIHEFPKAYSKNAQIPIEDFSESAKRAAREGRASSTLRLAKVIVIGDAGVGKTSLVMRYTQDVFDLDYKATIGVDFEVEKFDILGIPFTLQMWDTAGSERFQAIAASYYRGAAAVVICFDYSKIQTLQTVRKWLDNAISENPTQKFCLFLVGTKADLVSASVAREIEVEATKIANSMNAEYWSVSSKQNQNVAEMFARIGSVCFDKVLSKEDGISTPKKTTMNIGPKKILIDEDFNRRTKESNCPCQT
ncbi:Oidioi.mRNA.OKI2018_I69.chr2.g4542.t1.cds [Oikopleura dioica]|uniref:Oidioi.mRNA.OKI2018_I69.chr2.g4542.t1.cds n=1 Tax=Oikopleura dioica TaxID=34765 RepID=A0ABN7T396_OIKDI|nr:Oidioi.mRNA.OKI2018_I69.chr2.g4542.t1.cds [Oikopleura dioica]